MIQRIDPIYTQKIKNWINTELQPASESMNMKRRKKYTYTLTKDLKKGDVFKRYSVETQLWVVVKVIEGGVLTKELNGYNVHRITNRGVSKLLPSYYYLLENYDPESTD